jgi:hypothetical protein
MAAMRGKFGGKAVTVFLVALIGAAVIGKLVVGPRHGTRTTAAKPAPYVHPIVPSAPVVNPPPRSCGAVDLRITGAYLSALRGKVAVADARRLHGDGCRADDMRALQPEIDMIAQSVSGCVARDAKLDGAWNLVQSAVMAVRTCSDCAAQPAARAKGCDRTVELVAEADRARQAAEK